MQQLLSSFYKYALMDILRFWQLWLFIFLLPILKLCQQVIRNYRLSQAGIAEIDKMTGPEFELFLNSLFSNIGYKTEHTGKTGDFGCDLVIEMNGIRTVVQAKRYKNHVGEDAIREAYSVKNIHRCTEAMVVTNSYFTPMAKRLAQSDQVKLWNRDTLVDMILRSRPKEKISKSSIAVEKVNKYLSNRNITIILIIVCIVGFVIGFISYLLW